jgi:hypothetical protein
MRRNDYDVSNSVRTTDAASVGAEVIRLFKGLYGTSTPELERAFADAAGQPPSTLQPDIQPYPQDLVSI